MHTHTHTRCLVVISIIEKNITKKEVEITGSGLKAGGSGKVSLRNYLKKDTEVREGAMQIPG